MKKIFFFIALVCSIFSFNACDLPGIGAISGLGITEIVGIAIVLSAPEPTPIPYPNIPQQPPTNPTSVGFTASRR